MKRLLTSPFLILIVGFFLAALLFVALWNHVNRASSIPEFRETEATGKWHPMFARLDAFQRAKLPQAQRWCAPMGAENFSFSYNAQAYAVQNSWRGGRHTGDDLNGIGGENTDFGDRIRTPLSGLVVYTGDPSPGWGKVVVLAHKVDQEIVTTLYSHLSYIAVATGQVLYSGDLIGKLGTSTASDYAHLHWEWRMGTGISVVETAYEKRLPEQWVQRSPERIVQAAISEEKVGWPSFSFIQFAHENKQQKIEVSPLFSP